MAFELWATQTQKTQVLNYMQCKMTELEVTERSFSIYPTVVSINVQLDWDYTLFIDKKNYQ